MPEGAKIIPIDVVERRHKGHFFDASAKRFFRSRLPRTAYESEDGKYAYFVTSEQFVGSDKIPDKRKYTVRKADLETGDVNTVGEFQEFSDNKSALRKARELALHSNEKKKLRDVS